LAQFFLRHGVDYMDLMMAPLQKESKDVSILANLYTIRRPPTTTAHYKVEQTY